MILDVCRVGRLVFVVRIHPNFFSCKVLQEMYSTCVSAARFSVSRQEHGLEMIRQSKIRHSFHVYSIGIYWDLLIFGFHFLLILSSRFIMFRIFTSQ